MIQEVAATRENYEGSVVTITNGSFLEAPLSRALRPLSQRLGILELKVSNMRWLDFIVYLPFNQSIVKLLLTVCLLLTQSMDSSLRSRIILLLMRI